MQVERIRTLREDSNIRQIDMAAIIGIERSTYTSYELGRDTIPLKHLNKLCNYFNISIDYVMELTEKPKYPNSRDDIDLKVVRERLKEVRKSNNLTQVKISEMLNTSRSTWTGYENMNYLISTLLLYDVAKKYNYSMDYILGKTDYPVKLSKK